MGTEQENTEQAFNLIELIDTLKWPIIILIVLLILIKPIKGLINRITKVGYGDKSIEATQKSETQKIEDQEINAIDRAIGLFRPETIDSFNTMVEEETELDKLATDKDKIDRLKNYSTIIYIMRHFDSIHHLIYGSQIRILERLNTFMPDTRDSLKVYYTNAKKGNPKFYENYSYNDYMTFLFNFNLILEDNGAIKITILGVDFLKYLSDSGKDVNKLN